jgi:tetratricopeptide (TPR) repeat protein
MGVVLMACATNPYVQEKNRKEAESYRRLGDAYFRQGDYTQALRAYLQAQERYEPDPESHYSLGKVYIEKESFELAVQHLKRAIELNPDLASAQDQLAVAYIKMNRLDLAEATLKQMIDSPSFTIYLKPQYPKYLLGWVYYLQQKYNQAEPYFLEVVKYYGDGIPKDPIYIQNLRALGLLKTATGKPYEAINYFKQAQSRVPEWPDLYLDLARAYRLADTPQQARQAYLKVIEIAPDSDLAQTAAKEAATLNR